jgi:hypothetical protein
MLARTIGATHWHHTQISKTTSEHNQVLQKATTKATTKAATMAANSGSEGSNTGSK